MKAPEIHCSEIPFFNTPISGHTVDAIRKRIVLVEADQFGKLAIELKQIKTACGVFFENSHRLEKLGFHGGEAQSFKTLKLDALHKVFDTRRFNFNNKQQPLIDETNKISKLTGDERKLVRVFNALDDIILKIEHLYNSINGKDPPKSFADLMVYLLMQVTKLKEQVGDFLEQIREFSIVDPELIHSLDDRWLNPLVLK